MDSEFAILEAFGVDVDRIIKFSRRKKITTHENVKQEDLSKHLFVALEDLEFEISLKVTTRRMRWRWLLH